MTRHDMIERIGNTYMTSNIEGGEYSYIQEAGSRANLENALGRSISHFKLDIRFEKDDIVERFARGDKARSSDGNGLGLAIVSTYTAALGGSLDIKLDCDQFKVRISFPADDGGSESETIASETVGNCSAIS